MNLLTQELGCEPDDAQIATALYGSATPKNIQRVRRLRSISLDAVSLDQPRPDGDDWIDPVSITDQSRLPEDIAGDNDVKRQIDDLLAVLPAREARIVRMRSGLGPDQDRLSSDKVGSKIGLTGARVRQIEKATRAKLQANFPAE